MVAINAFRVINVHGAPTKKKLSMFAPIAVDAGRAAARTINRVVNHAIDDGDQMPAYLDDQPAGRQRAPKGTAGFRVLPAK